MGNSYIHSLRGIGMRKADIKDNIRTEERGTGCIALYFAESGR
jgi:hypothetical protein